MSSPDSLSSSRRALTIALREAGLSVREEVSLPVWFRGNRIATFKADLLVEPSLLIEVKAAPEIEPFHKAQLSHYLKATDLEVGLLMNCGRRPAFSRVIYENARKHPRFEVPANLDEIPAADQSRAGMAKRNDVGDGKSSRPD